MSRTRPDYMEKKRLRHPCRCGAKAGEWCRTSNGNTAQRLHTRRGANALRQEREQAVEPSS